MQTNAENIQVYINNYTQQQPYNKKQNNCAKKK